MIKENIIDKIYKNPFNYSGAKHNLLPFIQDNLPQGCTTLFDVFGGSGELAINLADNFDKIIYNEVNIYVYQMLHTFSTMPLEYILSQIDYLVNKYKLDKTNKDGFLKLREEFNTECYNAFLNTPLDDYLKIEASIMLYVLISHSFNNFLHINKEGKFMVSSGVGRMWLNPSLKQKLIDYINVLHRLSHKLVMVNLDFKEINFISKDILYIIDPPYFVSDDTYSRSSIYKWTEQDEILLYDKLNQINESGGKFMLFNALYCNDKVNEYLQDFITNYRIISNEEAFYNCNYQRKNGKTNEIVVTNY